MKEKALWEKNRMELFREMDCGEEGLTAAQAAERLKRYGSNELQTGARKSTLRIFLEQFADFLEALLRERLLNGECQADCRVLRLIAHFGDFLITDEDGREKAHAFFAWFLPLLPAEWKGKHTSRLLSIAKGTPHIAASPGLLYFA